MIHVTLIYNCVCTYKSVYNNDNVNVNVYLLGKLLINVFVLIEFLRFKM